MITSDERLQKAGISPPRNIRLPILGILHTRPTWASDSLGYSVFCALLLTTAKPFSKKKGEHEAMIELVTKFHDSLPLGLYGGLMANLSRTVHGGLQHVGMVGTSSVLLVLDQARVIVEYKANESEIVWTSFGRNPLDLVEKCLKQMDEFLRHPAHPARVRRRTLFLFRHEHCGSADDIEVDHSALRRPGHEVRWKVSMVPTLLSYFCEGLGRNEGSDLNQAGDDENRDFRFVRDEVLREISARRDAVFSYFGREPLEESCKRLSRVLELNNEHEVEKFGEQLQNCDVRAYEGDYTNCWEEEEFCSAISYTQHGVKKGRFKFSEEQWENLEAVLKEM